MFLSLSITHGISKFSFFNIIKSHSSKKSYKNIFFFFQSLFKIQDLLTLQNTKENKEKMKKKKNLPLVKFPKCFPDHSQKQPSRAVLRKRYSENVQHSNFIAIALRHGCSPVNLLHIFRTSFPKNSSGRLRLHSVLPFSAYLSKCLLCDVFSELPSDGYL